MDKGNKFAAMAVPRENPLIAFVRSVFKLVYVMPLFLLLYVLLVQGRFISLISEAGLFVFQIPERELPCIQLRNCVSVSNLIA